MPSTSTTCEWEGPSGRTWTVPITVTWHIDHHYGADLDGNRGVETTFLDDYEVEAPPADFIHDPEDLAMWDDDLISEEVLDCALVDD